MALAATAARRVLTARLALPGGVAGRSGSSSSSSAGRADEAGDQPATVVGNTVAGWTSPSAQDATRPPALPPLEDIVQMNTEDVEMFGSGAASKRVAEVPRVYEKQVDAQGRAYATGRRKDSVARVWVKEGTGRFIINGTSYGQYFALLRHREHVMQPLYLTSSLGRVDVLCSVAGGGLSGQAGAVRHGLAGALQRLDPGLREMLKPAGHLTRDSRVVERKKYGQKKARKKFAWVKR